MCGGVSGLFTFLGVGILGMHNVEIQQQTQVFKTDLQEIERVTRTVDETLLPTEIQKEFDYVKNSNAVKSGVVNQVERSTFISVNESTTFAR